MMLFHNKYTTNVYTCQVLFKRSINDFCLTVIFIKSLSFPAHPYKTIINPVAILHLSLRKVTSLFAKQEMSFHQTVK
jgi:hypothetical protein